MGFNTTVVVLNDALNYIEEDPDFGKKLAAAIRGMALPSNMRSRDVPAGHHGNAATVVETHHADGLHAILVGGNMGEDPGYVGSYRLDLSKNEDKRSFLKWLGDLLRVRVALRTFF